MPPLSAIRFTHGLVRALPGAPLAPVPPRQTPGLFYTETPPTPVRAPQLLTWSASAAALLGLPPSLDTPEERQLAAAIFGGNHLPEGCRPYATRYGGHQFGQWAGQLGDGRAIALGEVPGEGGPWEVQLKGAGPTPYSRRADGRAVLRSSLREYLCSEAMHHLGVPTTRALCCVTTGDEVVRDMFYDGRPEAEPGAITTRLSPSFLRLGHFEILAANQEHALLARLTATAMSTLYPALGQPAPATDGTVALDEDRVHAFFAEVAARTVDMVAAWQRVGFVHGVMNTDNLSVLGLTIDYGPYGWLDVYDPDWTPNTTDFQYGRYRFGNQPAIALWNLSRFAESLLPLFADPAAAVERFREALARSRARGEAAALAVRARKLGLPVDSPALADLSRSLDGLYAATEIDMTIFHRELTEAFAAEAPPTAEQLLQAIQPALYAGALPAASQPAFRDWMTRYLAALPPSVDARARLAAMRAENPVFVLRNYLVQEALDALADGDRAPLARLEAALATPYEDSERTRPYYRRRPDWARDRPGCSALSCSS